MKKLISVFGPMESLFSEGGLYLVGRVAKNLGAMLEPGRVKAFVFYAQGNWTVEGWNKTLIGDLACFLAAGHSD